MTENGIWIQQTSRQRTKMTLNSDKRPSNPQIWKWTPINAHATWEDSTELQKMPRGCLKTTLNYKEHLGDVWGGHQPTTNVHATLVHDEVLLQVCSMHQVWEDYELDWRLGDDIGDDKKLFYW